MDYILNGQGHGNVASVLMQNNFDPRSLRPWVGKDGQTYSTRVENGVAVARPVVNAPATLRKDDWLLIDRAIVKAAKPRLKFVGDLRSAGLTFTIPNGMGRTVLETETQSDINEATVSMDGLRDNRKGRPEFNIVGLPLPIIHKDFGFSARQIMVSRNNGSPLDTTTAELAARRVAEEAEKMALGVSSIADQFGYASYTIYGLTDQPSRNTKTITSPETSGWTAATTVQEVLQMRLQSQQDNMYGPWKLYCSTAWDVYMDDDYSTAKGDLTLRQRLAQIQGISGVETLDYLDTAGTAYILILIQMTPDVVREVIGMEITTVQWETNGGLELNFKVMAIMVPQFRVDFDGQSGIVHGTT